MLRVIWFILAGGVAYLLISLPFKYLKQAHPEWSDTKVSACSMGVMYGVFFFWNYFVNFRTESRKTTALLRYTPVAALMYLTQTWLLAYFKQFDLLHVKLWGIDLDVIATQAFVAPVKFFLYHLFAFPLAKIGNPGAH